MLRRPKLAFFSPLPAVRSGIADYSWEQLPALADHFEITLFVDSHHLELLDPSIEAQFQILATHQYPDARWEFDAALFQIGNHRFHLEAYQMFLRFGGVVVLHDFNIFHLAYAGYSGSDSNSEENRINLIYKGGRSRPDQFNTAGLLDIQALADWSYQDLSLALPLNNRLIHTALGLLAHSRYVSDQVNAIRADLPVEIIPQQMPIPAKLPQTDAPGPAGSPFLFGAAGQISKIKQIDVVLAAFAKVHRRFPNTHFLLIGELIDQLDFDVVEIIQALGLDMAVTITGYLPDLDQFMAQISSVDVLINLRNPTLGETSAAVLRGLAVGVPAIVYDHGWYSELPDDVVIKIPPGSTDLLANEMARVVQDRTVCQNMGENGRRLLETLHRPAHVATIVADFVKRIYRL